MPFHMVSFLAKVKIFRFGQKPWTIIRRFYRNRGDFLRSFYSTVEGATKLKFASILFLLRCPFIWYPFWPKSKFSDFGQKPWTIIRRFDRNRGHSLQVLLLHSGRCYEAEICVHSVPLEMPFHMVSFLAKVKIFRFWPKTMDYNKAFRSLLGIRFSESTATRCVSCASVSIDLFIS